MQSDSVCTTMLNSNYTLLIGPKVLFLSLCKTFHFICIQIIDSGLSGHFYFHRSKMMQFCLSHCSATVRLSFGSGATQWEPLGMENKVITKVPTMAQQHIRLQLSVGDKDWVCNVFHCEVIVQVIWWKKTCLQAQTPMINVTLDTRKKGARRHHFPKDGAKQNKTNMTSTSSCRFNRYLQDLQENWKAAGNWLNFAIYNINSTVVRVGLMFFKCLSWGKQAFPF